MHNNTVLSLASRPAFFSFLNAFNAALTSLTRAFLSFLERDLKSSIAAFTVEGSGSEAGTIAGVGTIAEEGTTSDTGTGDEAGTTTAALEEKLIAEARISNAKSKDDRFIVVDLKLVKLNNK